jgi:hypothetical protein
MPPKQTTQEINFRRLLKSCERLAAETRDTMTENQAKTFRRYLAVLKKQFLDLEKMHTEQKNGDLSLMEQNFVAPIRENLEEYKRKLTALERMINTEELKMNVSENVTNAQRTTIPSTVSVENIPQTAPKFKRRNEETVVAKEGDIVEEMLDYHRQLQDRYTEEMVMYAAHLKQNAASLSQAITKDLQILERMSVVTDQNITKVKNTNESLTQLITTSSKNSWSYWTILLFASLAFLFVCFFIKIIPKPQN